MPATCSQLHVPLAFALALLSLPFSSSLDMATIPASRYFHLLRLRLVPVPSWLHHPQPLSGATFVYMPHTHTRTHTTHTFPYISSESNLRRVSAWSRCAHVCACVCVGRTLCLGLGLRLRLRLWGAFGRNFCSSINKASREEAANCVCQGQLQKNLPAKISALSTGDNSTDFVVFVFCLSRA